MKNIGPTINIGPKINIGPTKILVQQKILVVQFGKYCVWSDNNFIIALYSDSRLIGSRLIESFG